MQLVTVMADLCPQIEPEGRQVWSLRRKQASDLCRARVHGRLVESADATQAGEVKSARGKILMRCVVIQFAKEDYTMGSNGRVQPVWYKLITAGRRTCATPVS